MSEDEKHDHFTTNKLGFSATYGCALDDPGIKTGYFVEFTSSSDNQTVNLNKRCCRLRKCDHVSGRGGQERSDLIEQLSQSGCFKWRGGKLGVPFIHKIPNLTGNSNSVPEDSLKEVQQPIIRSNGWWLHLKCLSNNIIVPSCGQNATSLQAKDIKYD